jgi:hypothetical protein
MQLRGNVNEINNLPTPTGEPVTANQLGEAVGARGARGLFGVMGEVIGRRFIGRPGGSLVAEGIYDAVTGYNRGRASRKSLTQLDAKREPAAEGNAPGKVDKGKRKKTEVALNRHQLRLQQVESNDLDNYHLQEVLE